MRRFRDGLTAGGVAAVISGAPSTLHAAATGRDVLEATRAAGSIALADGSDWEQIAAALPVHVALSLGWGVVLAFVLPRRHPVAWGAVAGLGIAALDLGILGRRNPQIRALPLAPQLADHVAFGMTVGWVLQHRRRRRQARA